jgi:cobalamin biosynthetic protein CobC
MLPGAPEPWIDLSTGINPIPYPVGNVPRDAWTRLPEPGAVAVLEAAARRTYGVPAGAEIVAAPGTQSIIQWLPRIVPARRVGILGPTYAEHALSWREAGRGVVEAETLDELEGCDAVVVVNPNNPDGRIVTQEQLVGMARSLAARDGLLVVDEAFMDVICPGASLIPALPESTIVLRSFGKTYGLGGLRLGFAVAPPSPGTALRAALGRWAISGPAIDIGRRALDDPAWLAEAIQRLTASAERLDRLLETAGFRVLGGTPLFRLAEHPEAVRWFARLGHAGILTRPFANRPSVLRLSAPHAASQWERLEAALGDSGRGLL